MTNIRFDNEEQRVAYSRGVKPQYRNLVNGLGLREDAGETAIIQRGLDYVQKQATEVMYPELRALQFVPVMTDVPIGAATVSYAVKDRVGRAKRTGGKGGDLPRANISLTENTSAIAQYGASYAYTTAELRAFDYYNGSGRGPAINLDTERAETAALMIARVIDNVVAFGDAEDSRIKGFANNSNVTVGAASAAWSTMTWEELLNELLTLANYPVTRSYEIWKPNTILLPTAQHQLITSTWNTLGSKTVAELFTEAMRAQGRSVEIASWPILSTADAGGTGPRAISYVKDVKVCGAIVPAAFIAQPPQPRDLEWVVPCEGLCGGSIVKQPLGVYYMDGL